MDTICALATAPGRAGVAVIRVSGPAAFGAVSALAGELPEPGTHRLRTVRGADGDVLDEALVLAFAGPRSFTGEDVVELQTHGSRAVVSAVLDALTDQEHVRHAEAGEFTRRALQNGRLNLTQVEGLADLIEAETRAQLDQALGTTRGALSDSVGALRRDLIRAAALIEATIDFADEEVPTDVTPEVTRLLDAARGAMQAMISGSYVAERVRTGFEVAIVGPPNAGKSTLLNTLAGRDAAITSDIAGTTRDVIEVRMDIKGLPVTLLDTAGMREGGDAIEVQGIARAIERSASSDLRVFLRMDDAPLPIEAQDGDIVLVAKDDSGTHEGGISGVTGHGVGRLLDQIAEILGDRVARASLASHDRHRRALIESVTSLDNAGAHIDLGSELADIAAEDIRHAIRALEVLVGQIGVEDLLDEIFSSFCIGK